MKRTYIYNAQIVNEGKIFQGGIVICDDIIEEVVDGYRMPSIYDALIDAHEAFLIPGVIDEHVHFRDPGLTEKGDISSESRAAVAGGVTSIMDMPNTNPQTTTLEVFYGKMDLMSKKCLANYSCYFGGT